MTLDRKISTCSLLLLATLGALFLMFWQLPLAHGQEPVACTEVIDDLSKSLRKCDNLNNNYACYGRKLAEALPFGEPFERTGDRIPIAAAEKIATISESGMVIMYVTAGDFDPVTIITFGDTEIEPDSESVAVNSFVARTINNEFICEQTPPGLIVYTESGKAGVVSINGIGITLHSAAYVIQDGADRMTVVNLNGQVTVTANGQARELPLGYAIRIQGLLATPTFIDPALPSALAQSAVARWLVDDPAGLDSIHNFDHTILSCSADNVTLPFSDELRLYSPGQECLLEFCAAAGERITVRMDSLTGQIDPWLDLRGPDQQLLLFNNNADLAEQDALLCDEPLPQQGCYTVVAHARHHTSQGAFRLSVEPGAASSCVKPPPLCEVTYHAGLNLRRGPEDNAAFIRALAQDTEVEPLESSASGARLKVRVVSSNEEGWVLNSAEALSCSGPLPTPDTPTPTPTGTPQTPTPASTSRSPTKTPTPSPIPTTPPPPPTPTRAVPPPEPTKQSPYG
ncbi:MAG: hypothetical protein R2911_10575 [Caldilineaceae bacterium]